MNKIVNGVANDYEFDDIGYYQQINIPARQVGKTFQVINMYEEKYKRLQSNWNSLRECIIGVIDGAREELNTIMQGDDLEYINKCSLQFEAIRKNLENVLDKMNELESGDNK